MHCRSTTRVSLMALMAMLLLALAAAPAPAASWLTAKDISPALDLVPFDNFFGSSTSDLAVDGKGNALAVWIAQTGGATPHTVAQWVQRPAGGGGAGARAAPAPPPPRAGG